MLIVCAGPDTYRAREKARELERAFREKYDPDGRSVERVDIQNAESVKSALLPLLSAGSLFSQQKFIRADGCLAVLKAPEKKKFASRISNTGSDTIIVSVEDEAPSKKVEDLFENKSLHVYVSPEMRGSEFLNWVKVQASERGVELDTAKQVAEYAGGDSWLAITELEKASAHPSGAHNKIRFTDEQPKIFDVTDRILADSPSWRSYVADLKDEGVVSTLLSQLRAYVRVQSGNDEGIHPYVRKKLSSKRVGHVSQKFLGALRAHVFRRKGLMDGDEYETLL